MESCINNSRLKLLRNCHTFFQRWFSLLYTIPTVVHLCIVGEFQFPHRHLLLSVFFDIASLVGVKLYFILVSICISPRGLLCRGSFLCPLSICLSSLEKSSEHFCPPFHCTLYLLLLTLKNSISILAVSVRYMIVKRCPIWGCLFISLTVSYEAKQLVILMKSIFFVCVWWFSFFFFLLSLFFVCEG